MQFKSQFNSGCSARKASAPRSLVAQFEEPNYSAQAMQPKSQFSPGSSAHKASAPGAQQLSSKSSTTQLRPCNPGVSSAQEFNPRSPTAQLEELSYSTQATQSRSCSTQTLNSGYAARRLIRFIQKSAKCTSRDKSGKK